MLHSPRAQPVGAEHSNTAARGALVLADRDRPENLLQFRGAEALRVELGDLEQRLLGGRCSTQLERPDRPGDLRLASRSETRRSSVRGARSTRSRLTPPPASRMSVSSKRSRFRSALGPGGLGVGRRADPVAADRALETSRPGRCGRGPGRGEMSGGPRRAHRGRRAWPAPPARGRRPSPRAASRPPPRPGCRAAPSTSAQSRPERPGLAEDDRDLVRRGAVREQPCDLAADRLRLGALAGRAQQEEAVAGLHALGAGLRNPRSR